MNKTWYIGILTSFLFHTYLLLGISGGVFKQAKKSPPEKVVSIKLIKPIKKTIFKNHSRKSKSEPKKLPPYLKPTLNKKVIKSNLVPEISDKIRFPEKENFFLRKSLKNIMLADVPQKTSLRKNPAYLNYYQLIRQKIRNRAYDNYEVSKGSGRVSLTFILNKNGTLKKISVDDFSPLNNFILKDIAVKSIKEATPFPDFPKELEKYQTLKFNISIQFNSS